jgi:hypothetical protein
MRVGRPIHGGRPAASLRNPRPTFVPFDQTKTPGSFPPEVLLEVSRQTIGIRSCAERGR